MNLRRRNEDPPDIFAKGGAGQTKSKKKEAPRGRRSPRSSQDNKPKVMTKQEIAEALAKKRGLAEVDASAEPVIKESPAKIEKKKEPEISEDKPPEDEVSKRTEDLERRSQQTKAASEALATATRDKNVGGEGVIPTLSGQGTNVVTHRTATITAKTHNPNDDIAPRIKPKIKREAATEKKPPPRARRRRRNQDKGGGKQPKVRKLDRRKYLEYKYEVRDILDDERILEEHRSNILGQVWAKGERIGISDTMEFIDLKVEELIMPEEIGEKIKELVKRFTTKR